VGAWELLSSATVGSVALFGLDAWTRRDELHRRVGYVPGDVALYPRLAGQDHVDCVGHLHRMGRSPEAAALAERLDLDLHRPSGSSPAATASSRPSCSR
jgi:ABC-2 type transport system ATP-binding protein